MNLKDIATPISGHQAEILRELVDHGQATLGRLIDQLYGSDPAGGPDNAGCAVCQHLVYIRKKLKPGWRIVATDSNDVAAKTRAVEV